MDNELVQFLKSAIKEGLSANEAFRQSTRTEIGIRRADFLDLFKQLKGEIQAGVTAIDRPGDRRPFAREIFVMETEIATGFMQHIDVWVRDRETGDIYPRPFSIATDELLTHDDAIETALEQFGVHAEKYGETILGATYRSTYVMAPKGSR